MKIYLKNIDCLLIARRTQYIPKLLYSYYHPNQISKRCLKHLQY